MACKNCNPVAEKRQLATPGEITRFIRRLRGLVEDGRIVEFPSHTDLADVEDDGSWPPAIECSFGCPDCGQGFSFKYNANGKRPAQWMVTRGTGRRR